MEAVTKPHSIICLILLSQTFDDICTYITRLIAFQSCCLMNILDSICHIHHTLSSSLKMCLAQYE